MLKKLLISLLLLLLLAAGTGYWLWLQWQQELARTLPISEPEFYQVQRGTALGHLLRDFEQRGWIEHAPLWSRWLQQQQFSGIQAGQYLLQPEQEVMAVLEDMRQGKVVMHQVGFPEGWTTAQWLNRLAQRDNIDFDVPTDMQALAEHLSLPTAHAEGWFFPDTYAYVQGTKASTILLAAHQRMQRELEQAWQGRDPELRLDSPYELLILASIVEKETGRDDERGRVASVFANRLRIGMRLQTDPTVIYGMGDRFDGRIRSADLREATPYNTYVIAGLPPTPIASPGLPSLLATANPDSTQYLYFVARGDGSSQFSTNLRDHNNAVNRYIRGRR